MSFESATDWEHGEPIERADTGIRILLAILFVLIARVVEAVLALVIVFELAYTLVTRRRPGERILSFANRTVSYFYRIGRFLTYNEERAPFPFQDFPPEVEPPEARPRSPGGERA